MALNSSGPLSIAGSTAGQSIELEFQGTSTNQLSMSQIYRGGGIVPNSTPNNGVPTSGAIAIGNFYGATKRIPIALTVSSNTQNYNIYNNRGGSYVAGISDITLTVNAVIGSSSTGAFALTVGSGFNAGDTVTIINNSYIVGCGGVGGNTPGDKANGSSGSGAGPALNADRAVTIYNYGVIGGGGGGGGGSGGGGYFDGSYSYFPVGGRTGGGGAGNNVGGAGSGGNGGGAAGSLSSGGAGGAGFYLHPYPNYNYDVTIGAGGSGGSLGAAGAGGGASYSRLLNQTYYGGGGGGAGACTSGNVRITWAVTGTRNGALN